jgi:anti-anti-sigma regulatory factor
MISDTLWLALATSAGDLIMAFGLQGSGENGASYIVLDMGSTSFVDATGLEVLNDLLFKAHPKLHVVLANPNAAVLNIFERAGLSAKIGVTLMKYLIL